METVKIFASDPEAGAYVIINKDDFNEKTMKLYDGPDNPEPAAVDASEAPKHFGELADEVAALRAELAALKAEKAVAAGEAPANGAWGDAGKDGKAAK